jgi:amino acid adenylation domain-containing protein
VTGSVGTSAGPAASAPASGFQQRIWLSENLEPNTTRYNVPLIWRLRGRLEPAGLEAALATVIERHEILHTAFREVQGQLQQVVKPAWKPALAYMRIDAAGEEGRAREAQRLAAEFARRRFDLDSGRLLRVALLDCGDYGQVFILCIHHLIWDEWSVVAFFRELEGAYATAVRVLRPDAVERAEAHGGALEATSADPPRTRTARIMAALWAEVLEVPTPCAGDSFFELGGHSLTAARLIVRVRERLEVDIAVRSLFEHSWLQDLADFIDREYRTREPSADGGSVCMEEALPTSGMQQRIWWAEQCDSRTAAYNISLIWHVAGRLDTEALGRAFEGVILRHEILRTRVVEVGGRAQLQVGGAWRPKIEIEDLSNTAAAGDYEQLAERIREAAGRPLDPEGGRPLRVELFDIAAQEQVLLITIHHLFFDGGSVAILIKELDAHLPRAAMCSQEVLAPPVQYRDFVQSELALRSSARGKVELDYWRKKLHGAPSSLALPAPARAEPDGAVVIPILPNLLAQLGLLQREHGVSWFMVFATAVAVILHRWSGQDDISFGCPVENRDDAGLSEVIGPCMNTVVLRSSCTAEMTLRELMYAMRDTVLEALEHKSIPFDAVIAAVNPTRRPGASPYIDVTLSLNVEPASAWALGGLKVSPFQVAAVWELQTKFALTITVLIKASGELEAVMSYRGDHLSHMDVMRRARQLGDLLTHFTQRLPQRLRDLGNDSKSPTEAVGCKSIGPAGASTRLIQYRDFVRSELALRSSARGKVELDYWRKKLHGTPSYLALPAPARAEPDGVVAIPILPNLLTQLGLLQREHGVSWFMVFATVVAAVLHRWSGQDDISFGCPVENRDQVGLSEVIGPCMNAVVLRSSCTAQMSLRKLMYAMRDTVLEALEHKSMPFDAVIAAVNPARRPGASPYVDTSLVMEHMSSSPKLAGLCMEAVSADPNGADYAAKFGVTFSFAIDDTGARGLLAYRGDRIARSTAKGMAECVGAVLDGFSVRLDESVDLIEIVGSEEEHRLRDFELGSTAKTTPDSVVALLRDAFERHGGRPAIASKRHMLTFGDLEARASFLAERLCGTAGDRSAIAIVLHRGENFIISMLATWLSGNAFCPIDPSHPVERIDFMLRDLGSEIVVTDIRQVIEHCTQLGLRVIDPTVSDSVTVAGKGRWPLPAADAVAYIIYTSGSTGVPKGVPIQHGSLANFITWFIATADLTQVDRGCHVSSVSFDVSQWEIWGALAAGACVSPYEETNILAPEFVGWLRERRVTVCSIPTVLAEAIWACGTVPDTLRWMFFAGSALSHRPPLDTPYRLCNAYGPTEAAIIASAHVCERGGEDAVNCIGRPIEGAAAYVLDGRRRRCPMNVPGELYLAGAGLSRGYWRRPELTAERFITCELDGVTRELYRTGDLARWLPSGNLEFLGRVDRQLKVRGFRVEPQEIEIQLTASPLVQAAFVCSFAEAPPSIVAYVVPKTAMRAETSVLIQHLVSRLPEYMVPRSVVWVDELPLNANGKVDMGRLRRPTRADSAAGGTNPAIARTALEERIARVWTSVLGIDRVGVNDNFFDVGGNSLLLMQMHTRLKELLGREFPIATLFQFPTVESCAGALSPEVERAGAREDGIQGRAMHSRRAFENTTKRVEK